jgi:hypothetical protein
MGKTQRDDNYENQPSKKLKTDTTNKYIYNIPYKLHKCNCIEVGIYMLSEKIHVCECKPEYRVIKLKELHCMCA